MLTYKHPKSAYVPHVQLSLSELQELCDGLVESWTHGETPSYLVRFQGTDGSEISTSDVALIEIENERVPSLIVEPTIIATADSDMIELRNQIVPSNAPGASATSFYVFNVIGSRPGWSAAVMDTTFKWLLRRRRGVFKFFFPILLVLAVLGSACLIGALFFGSSENGKTIHFTNLVTSLIVTGLAFIVAAVGFDRRTPRFSVVIRPATTFFTLANVAMLVGILGGLCAIYNGVMKALGR